MSRRTLTIEYFSITTDNSEEFLTAIDQVCQKFAVIGDDKKPEYGFRWKGV